MNYIKKGAVWLVIGAIIWSLVEVYVLYELYDLYDRSSDYGYIRADRSPLYMQFFKTLVPICVLIFAIYCTKHEEQPAVTSIADTSEKDTYV